jgi:hypothetical protein
MRREALLEGKGESCIDQAKVNQLGNGERAFLPELRIYTDWNK